METIPQFKTAHAAIERAGLYVTALKAMIGYDVETGAADGGTAVEPAFRLVSIAARTCLDQARDLHLEDRIAQDLKAVHDDLVAVNVAYYVGMSEDDRRHLAAERGFEFPEHCEWEDRPTPALVFWLNDAYPDDIIQKARVQARAYRRAGYPDKAAEVVSVASVRKLLREVGIDPDLPLTMAEIAQAIAVRDTADAA